jgi:general secretion pathway protein D
VILSVLPRVSPDNMVVMEVLANRSALSTTQSVPVGVSEGQPLLAPVIDQTQAQTTISTMNGQTVVLGGLITKRKNETHRKVPGLGDVPVFGRLFRYDSVSELKTEMLIILTPHVVRNGDDIEAIKRVEAARMNWCLTDVMSLAPDDAFRIRSGEWSDQETHVIYPDTNPQALPMPAPPEPRENKKQEAIPAPPAIPQMLPPGHPSTSSGTPRSPAAPSPPDLPREPAALPASSGAQSQPSPTASAAVVRVPAVESAQSSSTAQGVMPTVFDAPPRYPATQTPFYR